MNFLLKTKQFRCQLLIVDLVGAVGKGCFDAGYFVLIDLWQLTNRVFQLFKVLSLAAEADLIALGFTCSCFSCYRGGGGCGFLGLSNRIVLRAQAARII